MCSKFILGLELCKSFHQTGMAQFVKNINFYRVGYLAEKKHTNKLECAQCPTCSEFMLPVLRKALMFMECY